MGSSFEGAREDGPSPLLLCRLVEGRHGPRGCAARRATFGSPSLPGCFPSRRFPFCDTCRPFPFCPSWVSSFSLWCFVPCLHSLRRPYFPYVSTSTLDRAYFVCVAATTAAVSAQGWELQNQAQTCPKHQAARRATRCEEVEEHRRYRVLGCEDFDSCILFICAYLSRRSTSTRQPTPHIPRIRREWCEGLTGARLVRPSLS